MNKCMGRSDLTVVGSFAYTSPPIAANYHEAKSNCTALGMTLPLPRTEDSYNSFQNFSTRKLSPGSLIGTSKTFAVRIILFISLAAWT